MSKLAEVRITEGDFDVAAEYQKLCESAPKAGAVVFFVGLVRDFYSPKAPGGDSPKAPGGDSPQACNAQALDEKIDYLELQHYPKMTETLCQEIIDQARQRYSFDAARVVHRVGKIHIAEQIVMVAVASRNRDKAFQAAEYIMDYLKTRATFWKKEVGTRGQHWLGIKDKDLAAAKRWSED